MRLKRLLPGAILDAWGKRVIDRLYGKQIFPSGYLKLNDAGRAGFWRFDRVHRLGQVTRRGFLSASTVFYDDPGFAAVGTGSYQWLARWMLCFGPGH